jgi:negative regulator of sigma E activity
VPTEQEHRDALIAGANKIGTDAETWCASYGRDARLWRRISTSLTIAAGVAAAVAGGVAGISTLSQESRLITSVSALVAAGISAVAAGLSGVKRSGDSLAASIRDRTLADHASDYAYKRAPFLSVDDAAKAYEALLKERDQVVAGNPGTQLPRFGRRKRL